MSGRPTRAQTWIASAATGSPMSEVPTKNPVNPVRSMAKPEAPASTLPGSAQSEVSSPNWLAACSEAASVDM